MIEIILSGTAGILLLTVSIYLLYKDPSSLSAVFATFLIFLSLLQVIDVLLIYSPGSMSGYNKAYISIQSFLPLVLFLFSFTYGRSSISEGLSNMKRFVLIFTAAFPLVIAVVPISEINSPNLTTEHMLFWGNVSYWHSIGIMICCVIALVNVETAFSAMPEEIRYKIKYEFIGLCSILAILILYFSRGQIFNTINLDLKPVKAGVIIISALLILYSRSSSPSLKPSKITISRYMLYRSLTLFFVVSYFILTGLIGQGMQYLKISFPDDVAIFLSFVVAIVMAMLFFSLSLRRRVKVFLNKHFFVHKYDYREKWLVLTGRLALCKSINDVLNVSVTTFIDAFGFKGASVYLFSREKNIFYLAVTQDMSGIVKELQISNALTSYFVKNGRVLNLNDGEYVPTENEVGFFRTLKVYLVIPLIANDKIEGMIMCGKQLTTENFGFEDYDLMKIFARQATLSIANLRLSDELAETREMAAMAKISSFIIHDLKNQAYTLSLLLENAQSFIGDEEFQNDMIATVRNTSVAIKSIIDKLKRIPEKDRLERMFLDLTSISSLATEEIRKLCTSPVISFQGSPIYAMIDGEEIKKVIVNVILNAVDATSGSGNIDVTVGSNGEYGFVRISDDGCGMTEEFIKSDLFKPFRSTKKSGLGIGLYQCRQIVEGHCGQIVVNSKPGEGSIFTIFLPKQTE